MYVSITSQQRDARQLRRSQPTASEAAPKHTGEGLVCDGDGCRCPPCPPRVELLLSCLRPSLRVGAGIPFPAETKPSLVSAGAEDCAGEACSCVILINLGEGSSCPGQN